jgi:lysophospholipase L1-like esterase
MRFAAFFALLVSITAYGQPPSALLNNTDAAALFDRTTQLMESTQVAIPELNRAGEPLVENARQAIRFLKERGGHLPSTYTLLTNVRAYVLLADSVPKPFPFPELASKQLSELRAALSRIESHFAALIADREALLRTPDRDELQRYADANSKLAPPHSGKIRVVFLGDSITDSWRLNQYFPDQDYVNRGISGQITGQMLGRFKADVIDLHPQAVVVLAGTNDLARNVPLQTIENNYAMIADLADKHGIKVIFASVLPVHDYHKAQNPAYERTPARPPESIRALNDWLRGFCSQHGYAYLDYYGAMLDSAGLLRADLADDGLHPNAAGYRIMAPLAENAIRNATASPAQQKSGRFRQNKKES